MSHIWTDMFALGLPLSEKILRSIFVYIFLIVGLRIAGKRELAQLNPFDLIVLLTLSNTVQNAIIGDDNSVSGGLVGAATLLFINYLVVRFLFSHPKLEHLAEGNADVLIHNGNIMHRRLKKEMLTEEEMEVAARRQGFTNLSDVDSATLEPSGIIVFTGKKPDTGEARHQELVENIKRLSDEIAELKKSVEK